MPTKPAAPRPEPEPIAWATFLAGAAVIAMVAAAYLTLSATGLIDVLSDTAALRSSVHGLGPAGPAALIALEALAIVLSPLPSAPIALVAGAAYGALWGTILIVVGAEIGAIAAFLIARWLGFETIRRWAAMQNVFAKLGDERSQWGLMGLVFVSRLLPFVSFDAVSYAAGLTPLSFWRFAVATFAGIIPVSFLLTYAGEGVAGMQSNLLVMVLLVLVAAPFVAVALRVLWRGIVR
jgi:uncharacterized membrane protein YdjX (TVP38/TMEM64 family)